jgi:hypothetical protein
LKERVSIFPYVLLGIPVLVALVLYGLGRDLGAAERALLERASASFYELTSAPYSPLYLLALHLWSSISQNPFWLHLSGVLAGLVALILSVHFLRHLGGAHATPGALLLLAASPFFVGQVHLLSATPASLVAVLVCFLCFLQYTRSGSLNWLGGWTLATLLAWGIHAGLGYMLVVQWVYMVAYREHHRGRLLFWWLAQIPLTVFFLLVFGGIVRDVLTIRLPAVAGAQLLRQAADLFGLMSANLPPPVGLVGGAFFLFLLGSGVWTCRDWRRDPRHGLVLLGFAVPFLLWLSPVGHAAYALAALPCLLALVSMGLRLYPRWVRQLLWSLVGATYLWGYWYLYQ